MKIRRSKRFLKEYIKLPENVRKKLDRKFNQLIQNHQHPSLDTKKMVNRDELWEARIEIHHRLTFEIRDNILILRRVGTHEIDRNS